VYIQYLQNNKILTKRLYVSSHRHKSIEKLGAIIILYVRVASCNWRRGCSPRASVLDESIWHEKQNSAGSIQSIATRKYHHHHHNSIRANVVLGGWSAARLIRASILRHWYKILEPHFCEFMKSAALGSGTGAAFLRLYKTAAVMWDIEAAVLRIIEKGGAGMGYYGREFSKLRLQYLILELQFREFTETAAPILWLSYIRAAILRTLMRHWRRNFENSRKCGPSISYQSRPFQEFSKMRLQYLIRAAVLRSLENAALIFSTVSP